MKTNTEAAAAPSDGTNRQESYRNARNVDNYITRSVLSFDVPENMLLKY